MICAQDKAKGGVNMAVGTVKLIDTFFMMVAVVPMSKMLSSIFMKMAIRNGTVNNEKWAAIGLGTLGGVAMIMKRDGMLRKMTGMGGGQNASNINGRSGASAGGDNGGSATNANSNLGRTSRGYQPTGNQGQAQGSGASQASQTSGTSYSEKQEDNTPPPPQRGQRTMQDIVTQSSKQSNKFAKGAAKVGVASSFAAPEVAPVMAGIYGAAGKATAGVATTAHHIRDELKARNKKGQDFSSALQQMTGSKDMVKATMKASAVLAMSPFGARVTNLGMRTMNAAPSYIGKMLDYT